MRYKGLGVVCLLALGPCLAQADVIDTKLAQCWSCHGAQGRSDDATIPVIWGQNAGYIVKQLNDYREGARDNQIMSSMAESINRADMQLYAQRIAAHEWPQTPAAQMASSSSLLQSCMGCHGADLGGQQTPVGYAPRLAGQNDGYLLEQMQSFVNGVRANQPAMSALMQALSDDEQRQLAQVIAHLP